MTSPNASETMPIMAKCTGSMWTVFTSGSRIVPTMMIAGIASRKHPTARNANATKKPVAVSPIPQAWTPASRALGIW